MFSYGLYWRAKCCLNEVRPRRPEQCLAQISPGIMSVVSMKSGLEGRNNGWPQRSS